MTGSDVAFITRPWASDIVHASVMSVTTRIETSENWVSVGYTLTGVYISPSIKIGTLRRQLLEIPPIDNIVGDLNCTP